MKYIDFFSSKDGIRMLLGDMMVLISNIKGYHINDYIRCKKFLEDSIPIFSNDTHFLGYGMYFWDNEGNSKFWFVEQKRKNNRLKKNERVEKFAKVSAKIIVDNILDLTDLDVIDEFNKLWLEYSKKEKCSADLPFGEKLDRIFDFFDLLNIFPVIRVYVKYKGKKEPELFTINDNCRLTVSVNQIYSVRDKKAIAEQELMEVYEA